MALEGLHHITAITADAPRNVDFYARALGLRLVKKTVNFDQPDVYHLYYGDEAGTPGSILTFFEFPHAAPGHHGDGMPYRVLWRVQGPDALEFWSRRLGDEGFAVSRTKAGLLFADPEGLEHELVAGDDAPDAPLAAVAPDIPPEHALLGFAGVRAYAADGGLSSSAALLEALGFTASAGARPTPIIDRQYFHSVYFREPSGVLLELASRDIGFDVDEPEQTLGEELKLPPRYEARREQLQRALTPITNPRAAA